VGGFAVLLALSSRQPTTPEGFAVLDNVPEFHDEMARANAMTQQIFEKVDNGGTPSPAERQTLLEAAKVIDSANRFDPSVVSSYLGSGKAYLFSGDDERAEERLRQADENLRGNKSAEATSAAPEIHLRLSQLDLRLGRDREALAEADEANRLAPNTPLMMVGLAEAQVKNNLIEEAAKNLQVALSINPDFVPARKLQARLNGVEN
jgi:tetratricopeptide (TPR) repeat protein